MSNLPTPPTPLIGREHDLDAACRLLERQEVRLLTFLGPAGVGKTRLAVAAAQMMAAEFQGDVYFADLAPIEAPDRLLNAVASALGVKEGPAEPLEDQLKRYVGQRGVLLLLDNFEQIVVAAPALAGLLAGCPALKVLVTSRVPLQLSWEHRFPVPGLVLPDLDEANPEVLAQSPAVTLFADRARAVLPDFDLNPQNALVLAEICTRLDGLPLAIELAAAQVDVLPLHMILEGLRDSGLDLLAGGARDQPQRHQTLRSAIAWSERLLEPDERDVFTRLAVFAGGCTLDAAAAVCDAPEAMVSKVLASLVRKNLLHFDPWAGASGRYRMLEMVREYALEHLRASGREGELRELHLRWCLSMAASAAIELHCEGQLRWLNRLDEELDNLRSAMTWCLRPEGSADSGARIAVDLDRFWEVRHITEGSRWLESYLERLGPAQNVLRAQVLVALGILAVAQSKIQEAAAYLAEGHGIALAARNQRLEVRALWRMSLALAFLGKRERGRELLEQCLALSEEIGDLIGRRYATYHLANSTSVSSPEEALPLYAQAQTLCREAGDIDLLRWALGNEGRTHEMLGDYERAGVLFRDAFRMSLELQSPWGIVTYFYRLAGLAGLKGSYKRAALLHGVAEVQRQRYGIGYGYNGREPDLPQVRAALGDPVFHAYQAEGRALKLEEAIELALRKDLATDSAMLRQDVAVLPVQGSPHGLSRREVQVLRLIATGCSNKEIAEQMVLSIRTVERHINHIYEKIDVHTKAQATAYALRQGLG